MGAAVFLILGGFLSVLPVFGLWMLPLGLALTRDLTEQIRRNAAETQSYAAAFADVVNRSKRQSAS